MKRGRAKVAAAAVVHAAAAWAAVAAAVIIATAAARAAAGAGAGKLVLPTIIAAGSRVRREVPRRFARRKERSCGPTLRSRPERSQARRAERRTRFQKKSKVYFGG